MLKLNINFVFLSLTLFFQISSDVFAMKEDDDSNYFPKKLVTTETGENTDLFTGILYKIRSNDNALLLDSSDNGTNFVRKEKEICQDQENNVRQLWVLQKSLRQENRYIIVSVASGKCLESRFPLSKKDGIAKWTIHENSDKIGFDSRELWSIQKSSIKNNYCLKTDSTDKFLDSGDPNDNIIGKWPTRKSTNPKYSRQSWEFIPAPTKIYCKIDNFNYKEYNFDLDSLLNKVSLTCFEASNLSYDGNPDIKETVINETIKNFSAWSFSKSEETTFLNQLDVDIEAGYCGIKGNIHNTTKWENKTISLENSKKENLDETTVIEKYKVEVPPRKKVEVKIIWHKVDVEIPFTARATLTGYENRLKKNREIEKDVLLNTKEILHELKQKNCNVKFLEVSKNNLFVELSGVVKVTGATKGIIEKHISDL